MLSKKLENINTVSEDFEKAKTEKQLFEREISKAQNHNSGSLTTCGKCHLKIGHNRRICDGDQCASAMLCGILEKHPDDKAKLRSLSQKVEKLKIEITKLQTDYQNKLRAYKSVEDSFAKRVEDDIISTDRDKYIINGVKNWALLSKHVTILERKCNGKLPPRNLVGHLLKEAVHEHEHKSNPTNSKRSTSETCVNPKRRILEQDYAIRFPVLNRACSYSATSVCPPMSSAFQSDAEENDFRLAISLQNELINQESRSSVPDNCASVGNVECKATRTETNTTISANEENQDQEQEAAMALVNLTSINNTSRL